MTELFDDPEALVPADVTPAEARAYERAILRVLHEGLKPGAQSPDGIASVRLDGERPGTEVVIQYRARPDGPLLEVRAPIWGEGAISTVLGREYLDPPRDVARWINDGLAAREFPRRQIDEGQ